MKKAWLKRKPPKHKIPSKTRLRNKCDKLIGAKCRSIGYCEFCGKKDGTLQWIHYITRAIIKLRYDCRNYACGCAICHFRAHDDPHWFTEQWKKLRGKDMPMILSRESNELKPITTEFYENIIKKLK